MPTDKHALWIESAGVGGPLKDNHSKAHSVYVKFYLHMVDRRLASISDGFGERLRAARLERGLTQRELADVCQLPHTAVSQFETGARAPGFTRLLRLAVALDVSIDYLAGRTDSRAAHLFSGGELGALGLSEEDLELLRSIARRLARDEGGE